METYNDIKNKLLDINRDIRRIIRTASSIGGLSSDTLEPWQSTTARIERQLTEEMIRVAVVGSIKSGKSTLINSLFAGDYLKRGAGVVTSIITKVRPGHDLRARLEFKTWDEINAEIDHALILFSSTQPDVAGGDFDINREKDRLQLQQDLSELNTDQLIADDARDPNSVLLFEYLKGYDRVKDLVSFEQGIHIFESQDFHKQKDFVGDESMAVYLKDVYLTLDGPEAFGENLEIADCQGSDSPNPLHLAMIQDYLIQTHLIIYALSSRTGIRQADIKFLRLIKKMGLTRNIFFVVNCDLSEHDSLADLRRLASRVQEEINMIFPSHRVFAFSALYNLFKSIESEKGAGHDLSRKDNLRLEQWREDADMIAFSDQETVRFLTEVTHKISMDRFALLLESNLERISNIAYGMRDWVQINQELLLKDAEKVQEAFVEMDRRQQTSNQVTVVIKDTLDGTTGKLKEDLGAEVERFFDLQYGEIVQKIVHFVDTYDLSARDYEEDLETSGFLPTLYRIFQSLRQAANRFIAESIHPKLVDFIRKEEKSIEDVFEGVSGPYSLMIQDAVDHYQQTAKKLGINIPQRPFKTVRSPDIALVKSDAQLIIPRLAGTMRYTTRIKTEAILRLGFYKTLKAVKRLFKRPVKEELESAIRSLEDSVHSIKEEIQQSITDHLLDYKENLKYQYLFKLVDAISGRLYEALIERMTAFSGSLLDIRSLIQDKRMVKHELEKQFASMESSLNAALDRIGDVERLGVTHSPSYVANRESDTKCSSSQIVNRMMDHDYQITIHE
ncbi:MAG: dynamin family protein [Desulfobacterales bacterium]|nr:dynamin family protein [Desulfobacterales bacterium]